MKVILLNNNAQLKISQVQTDLQEIMHKNYLKILLKLTQDKRNFNLVCNIKLYKVKCNFLLIPL